MGKELKKYEYDNQNNWVKSTLIKKARVDLPERPTFVIIRKIEYY